MPTTHLPPQSLDTLRQQVRRLEGYKPQTVGECIQLGVADIDDSFLSRGIPLGTTHEFISQNHEDAACTSAFVLAALSRFEDAGTIVWVTTSRTLYPAGLMRYGINPARVVFVNVTGEKNALWAIEEVLRCKNILAVVGEINNADLKATRRFQLAVEKSGVTGFLMRICPKQHNLSACASRWSIRSAPSVNPDGLPGIGIERWQVELQKNKYGQTGQWILEWEQGFRLAGSSVTEESRIIHRQFG